MDVHGSIGRAALGGMACAALALGIGLAAQLTVDGRTVLNAPNLGWRDEAFADRVENAVGEHIRVRIANGLSAIVWGETCVGPAKHHDDVPAV